MDNEAFRSDLVKVLEKMPMNAREEVRRVVSFAFANKDALEAALSGSMEAMMPHISTLAMEKAMGILDMKGIEETVKEALEAVGVIVPKNG